MSSPANKPVVKIRADGSLVRSVSRLIFIVVLVVLFVPVSDVAWTGLGWRAVKLDTKQLFGDAHLMGALIDDLLHPNILVRELSTEVVLVKFKVPCDGPAQSATAGETGHPLLILTPACANYGDPLVLEGRNFSPNSTGKINYARFDNRFDLATYQADSSGSFKVELTAERRLGFDYQFEAIGENPNGRLLPSQPLLLTLDKMYETIMLALMATLFGVVLAIPLSFFGARNLMLDLRGPGVSLAAGIILGLHSLGLGLYGGDIVNGFIQAAPLSLGPLNVSTPGLAGGALLGLAGALIGIRTGGASIYYLARLYQNIFRSIESLIVATLFVVWVGIGPAAGTLALAVNTAAGLGKLCSEAIESIEPGPIEAIKSTGANFLQTVAFAVVPQVVPQFIGYILYRWDGNVRFSTVLGFVGGGGIGFILIQWINLLQYRNAAVAVWAITLIVYIMDYSSTKLRARIV